MILEREGKTAAICNFGAGKGRRANGVVGIMVWDHTTDQVALSLSQTKKKPG